MRKLIVLAGTAALLAIPAGATASDGAHHGTRHHARNVARQQCRAERLALGAKAFRQKYGTPHAFANCVRAHRPTDRAAAQACRAERRQIGKQAFRQKYGRNPLNQCIKVKTAG